MQNAKDTFFEVLRGRLTALNPERTISVRGVVRPGLLVGENELASAVTLAGCFRMTWGEIVVDALGAMPTVTIECSISYETAGTSSNGGMDRGRALEQMDGELLSAIGQAPMRAQKTNYSALSSGGTPQGMGTNIWWGDLSFGKVTVNSNRIGRTATVQVMSLQEQGEL